LYYLLSFPLVTLTALLVLRRLGCAYAPALAVALLYAFLPYHTRRIGHLFLSAYWLVPPAVLLVVRTYPARSPFARPLAAPDTGSLGLVGSIGFLYLLGRLCLRRPGRGTRLADGLAVLTLAGLLLATVGGLGVVLSLLAAPEIRAYNRIVIFLAFFSFAAVAL